MLMGVAMKRLLSLLLVVSSFSWSSLLRASSYEGQADGVEETKGEVAAHMPVTLKYLDQDGVEHSVVVPAAQISSFNLINMMLPEEGEEAGELEIPIASQIGSLAAFRFLEVYLQSPDQALKLLSEMPGEQIVDALQLLDYLQFDFFTPVGQKLQVELLAQLRKKLSPEVIVHAWGKLGSLRLLEFRGGEVLGEAAGWSPDGQRLWVKSLDNGASKIRILNINLLDLQNILLDLWNKLTLAQELLLLYLVRERQATGEVYKLLSNPKLWPVWMSLSGELREYLVRDGYVGRDHRTLKRTIPKF